MHPVLVVEFVNYLIFFLLETYSAHGFSIFHAILFISPSAYFFFVNHVSMFEELSHLSRNK